MRITAERRERMRAARTKITEFLYRITEFYARANLKERIPGFPVHDLAVMAYAGRPELFETKRLPVGVDTESSLTHGMTVADFRPYTDEPANGTVCMSADGDGILDWYERVVTSSE